jgi:hypothetical protein
VGKTKLSGKFGDQSFGVEAIKAWSDKHEIIERGICLSASERGSRPRSLILVAISTAERIEGCEDYRPTRFYGTARLPDSNWNTRTTSAITSST